ncbi:hypothetical protein PACTADRAFT_4474 [Pachysolen tannophilus NRRL Y-2460]|uniref:Uncharacterized protein n=1 Tax=Pachysolen tannophilus NRRL Y-2460 TaxID=669874 RepID=A0A1E4TP91_PACTA|nr:hypothetical protein PACTADRAFT_4474 [Pachysolen tannophilus NRRL Y-2460]
MPMIAIMIMNGDGDDDGDDQSSTSNILALNIFCIVYSFLLKLYQSSIVVAMGIDDYKYDASVNLYDYLNSVFGLLVNTSEISNDDLNFLYDQINAIINREDLQDLNNITIKLIANLYLLTLSKLLSNGYFKFQIKLIELSNKFLSFLNSSKLTIRTYYSIEKQLAVHCLSLLYIKFGGFLNSFKSEILNISYKHLKKIIDNFNHHEFNSHYFDQFLVLIDVVLRSNVSNLDVKTMNRLFKLHKLITTKTKYTVDKEVYSFSILSIIHVNNILTSLLKTETFVSSIATKKSHNHPYHYINSIALHLSSLVSALNTNFKNLRLSVSKNISDLLVFSYINYGFNTSNEDTVFNFTINYIWENYLNLTNNYKIKIGLVEVLTQFLSKLNLYFQSGSLGTSASNFVSLKSFQIIDLTLTKIFNNEKPSKENNRMAINTNSNYNDAINVLSHLTYIYEFLLEEIRSDINKAILLVNLFENDKNLDTSNSYKTISCLNLIKALIKDLDQYLLTRESSSIERMQSKLLELSLDRHPYIRVVAIETLTQLLLVTDSNSVLSKTFKELNDLIENKNKDNSDTFIKTHSKSLLIASVLSQSNSIPTDFSLSLLSLSTSFLKKFSSSVLINNLVSGNDFSSINNENYERQVMCWILMMGLFNYYTESKNIFLFESSQLLNIWKSLLAHNIPSHFIKYDRTTQKFSSFNELMKFLEIKNNALSCLVCFINYSEGTFTPDLLRQITLILTKAYNFILSIEAQLTDLPVPTPLKQTLQLQKLRVLTCYIKLAPQMIEVDEFLINSDLLVHVIKNFNDYKLFNYVLASESTYSKTKDRNEVVELAEEKEIIDEMDIYGINDGLTFGLTSKINMFQVDELLIKSGRKNSKKFYGSDEDYDIDTVANSTGFIIESKSLISNLSSISKFEDLARSLFQPCQPNLLNDYLSLLLFPKTHYSNTKINVVSVDTMITDISIELFELIFPHLSIKVQQSVLETIRLGMLYSGEKKLGVVNDKNVIQHESFNYRRQKAIIINSSVAIHGMLNALNSKLMISGNAQNAKLYKLVATIIIDTIKRLSSEDLFVNKLNAESVGLCLSLLNEDNKSIFNEQVNYFINHIVENNLPYSRSSDVLTLAYIFKYNNKNVNPSSILNVVFALNIDPHPVVHHWSLEALVIILENYINFDGSNQLLSKVLKICEQCYTSDEYGINSKLIISSNLNFTYKGADSNLALIKLTRVLVNLLGPSINLLSKKDKKFLKNFVLDIMLLTTSNYDLISRELIKIFDELMIFDKNFFKADIVYGVLNFLMVNNFKTGCYNENLPYLPLLDVVNEAEKLGNVELYPMTTSDKLIELVTNSYYQLLKINSSPEDLYKILSKDLQPLLWIILESSRSTDKIFKIFQIWLETDVTSISSTKENKLKWLNDLTEKFNFIEQDLYKPLNEGFKNRINNSGSLFVGRSKVAMTSTKQQNVNEENKSFSTRRAEGDENDSSDEEVTINPEGLNTDNENNLEGADNDDQQAEKNLKMVDSTPAQQIAEEEPISWRFKIRLLKLLIQLLSYTKNDRKLYLYISTRISDLVRIAFVSSTSQLLKLRFLGLELLGDILDIYADLKDPLYPTLSILDQQQAQIISAIIPAFTKGSNIDLASQGFTIASKLISSNITTLARLSRIIKILTSSIENLSIVKANRKPDNDLKIGDIEVITVNDQNKILLSVLNCWANLKNNCSDTDGELKDLIDKYMEILAPMWIYSIKEFSMLKYGGDFFTNQSDSITLDYYQDYRLTFLKVICLIFKENQHLISKLLEDSLDSFYFIIFGQCIEILFKTSSSSSGNSQNLSLQSSTLQCLKNLLTVKSCSKVIFHDLIFSEVIDLLDKLLLIDDYDDKLVVIDISTDIYLCYFDSDNNSSKSEEELHNDIDKLFELVRIVTSGIVQILPFIVYGDLDNNKPKSIKKPDLMLLKKSFSSLIIMITKLPTLIQIDLCSCLLYIFALIYKFDNNDIITNILPMLKTTLGILKANGQEDLSINFYKELKPVLVRNKSNTSLLTYMIFIGTDQDLALTEDEIETIVDSLIRAIASDTSVAIATQSIKKLILQSANSNNNTSSLILKNLIPKLIKLLINNEVSEPRLIMELLMLFTKQLTEEKAKLSSYSLLVPLLLWFDSIDRAYVHKKLLDLIRLDTEIFKTIVSDVLNSQQKLQTEMLVKFNGNEANGLDNNNEAEDAHIELKTFGAYRNHVKFFGKGIYRDIRERLVFYKSDFVDGFKNYRVIPATVYIFFTNLLPAIAFALDMYDKTHKSYGVNEVLLSSAMGGIVFGLFSGQPLCIVGVTGPISIFNYTVYDIIEPKGIPYFAFMCWICLWSALFHFILAFTNAVNYLRYVTKYSCNVFGVFINIIYIQKGIQILCNQFNYGTDSGFMSVMVSLLMFMFGSGVHFLGINSQFFKPMVRKFLVDYGTPLSIVFFTGFVHFGGYMNNVNLEKLPITRSFHPTSDLRPDDWFIRFWEDIKVGDVFLALPFALLLTCLFYFDHNISSLMCQGSEFPLKKPASFHWDFCLLGLTTGISGILGIPAPNGLIPQAPLHTSSLCVYKYDYKTGQNKAVDVVEQRVTNTLQGLLTIGMMTRPLLVVLGTIPQAVLAGLFWIMGVIGLYGNDITRNLKFICTDKRTLLLKDTNVGDYSDLMKVDKKWFYLFLSFEILMASAEVAITETRAAVGFPGILLFSIFFSCFFPLIFPQDQLQYLNGPAVEEFTLKNLNVGKLENEEDIEKSFNGEKDSQSVIIDIEDENVGSSHSFHYYNGAE